MGSAPRSPFRPSRRLGSLKGEREFSKRRLGCAPSPAMAPGEACAAELLYTGRVVPPEEALRIGLVQRVAAPEDVLTSARALATEIAAAAPLAAHLLTPQ